MRDQLNCTAEAVLHPHREYLHHFITGAVPA